MVPGIKQPQFRKLNLILFILLGIAYFGGLILQIMEIDAAQYAAMSMEMLQRKSYLQLYDGGLPYLDKPPLLICFLRYRFLSLEFRILHTGCPLSSLPF
jgi:hypothetical protein